MDNKRTTEVFIPCAENDPRCCGGYTSNDGTSLCHVRESKVPIIEHGAIWRTDSYDRLYDQVNGGKRTVCYVDYNWPKHPSIGTMRDICTIGPERIEFVSRGHGYGSVEFMPGDYKTNFIGLCKEMNVEWLDESGTASTGSDEPTLSQSRADFIREVNDRDMDGLEAIEFAEWAPTIAFFDDEYRLWELLKEGEFINGQFRFTTKELYKLFKQQKDNP